MRGVTPTAEPTRRFETGEVSPEIRTLDESFTTLMQSLAAERGQLERRTVELAAANTDLREEVQERERVEQALRESEAQLRQSQKLEAIGTLAGGIAHDFNNLLTVITGYTQLALLRTPAGDSMRDDLKQVIEASDRAAKLTHQLLAFSRKQVFLQSVIDLGAVVDGVAPMLRRLIGETHRAAHRARRRLARIIADRGQLEQVIINLVVNARDAMPNGRRRSPFAPRTVPAERPARRALGQRHRHRHRARGARAHLRALLHDEGSRERARASACRPCTESSSNRAGRSRWRARSGREPRSRSFSLAAVISPRR